MFRCWYILEIKVISRSWDMLNKLCGCVVIERVEMGM